MGLIRRGIVGSRRRFVILIGMRRRKSGVSSYSGLGEVEAGVVGTGRSQARHVVDSVAEEQTRFSKTRKKSSRGRVALLQYDLQPSAERKWHGKRSFADSVSQVFVRDEPGVFLYPPCVVPELVDGVARRVATFCVPD